MLVDAAKSTLLLVDMQERLLPAMTGGAEAEARCAILLAAAPCTAMVFVWSRLTNGDPLFTLSQVALNDSIMVFAFAPLVGLLLGVASITVPWRCGSSPSGPAPSGHRTRTRRRPR